MQIQTAVQLARLCASCSLDTEATLPSRPHPMVLLLWLTPNCNARCQMCDAWKSTPTPVMSANEIGVVLDDAVASGIQAVRFSGGEPLLRQNFAEILDQLNRHQFPKAVLATNGLLIDRQLEAINESALTQLTVSLDGMRSDHDVLRGVPGAFDRVVRNLRRVRKRVKIATLLTRRLLPHLDEFLRLCRDEGWDLEYSPLHKNGPPFYLSARVADNVDQLQPSADELDEMFERFEAYGFATPAVAASARHFARSRSLDFSHCINGYLSVLVYWNGDVRAGCLAFESIGNLADVSLPTLLASAGYRTDAERGFRMDCPRSCAGSSPSVAAAAPFRSLRYALARLH